MATAATITNISSLLMAAGPRPLRLVKNLFLGVWIIRLLLAIHKSILFRGVFGSIRHLIWCVAKWTISFARTLPTPASDYIRQQINDTLKIMATQLHPPTKPGDPAPYKHLPVHGLSRDALRKELSRYRDMSPVDCKQGKVSGAVYHGGDDLNAVISEAFTTFLSSNPLHVDLFPGIRKMEAEIIRMVIDLYHGGQDACGNLTSGGTESILMACKAYRELARLERDVTEPEMIVPDTVHAAFDKAAHYFNIKLVRIPTITDYRVDLKLVQRSINRNTIMLVGSSPNFPHGIVDDIEGLSTIAMQHKLPLHVDCCLGSFLMAFMPKAGFNIPPFDFRVPGVTSMSVDTHKYGFAPKGSSVIMYRNSNYRKHQYFVAPDWSGGVYASPTIAGSRPGALIAGCWATMLFLGKEGYIDATKKIISTARAIKDGIRIKLNDDLEVIGDPQVSVVAFRSKSPKLNIFSVNDVMSKSGWNLNALQYPEALHIACTYLTYGNADLFINDLIRTVVEVKAHPDKYMKGSAAIYGMAASIPDRSIVHDLVVGYLDLTTQP